MKQITAETYYRRSLALPLVVPLVVYLVGILGNAIGKTSFDTPVYWLITGSLFFGGIPYGLLSWVLLRWSRGKTERQIFIQTWLAPLWIAGLLLVGYGIWIVLAGGSGGGIALLLAGFGLGFGYAYVLLVNFGLWLFRKVGLILPSEAGTDTR